MQINGECPLNGYLAKEDHLIVWSHDLNHQEVMVFKYFFRRGEFWEAD